MCMQELVYQGISVVLHENPLPLSLGVCYLEAHCLQNDLPRFKAGSCTNFRFNIFRNVKT